MKPRRSARRRSGSMSPSRRSSPGEPEARLGRAGRVRRARTPLPAAGRRRAARHAVVAGSVSGRHAGAGALQVPGVRRRTPTARFAGEIAAPRARSHRRLGDPQRAGRALGLPRNPARLRARVHRGGRARSASPTGARACCSAASMTLGSRPWLRAAFAAGGRGFDALDRRRQRARARAAREPGRIVRRWRGFFARARVEAPLWVTEHGYPSDPRYQHDPRIRRRRACAGRLSGAVGPGVARKRARRACSSPSVTISAARLRPRDFSAGRSPIYRSPHPVVRRKPAAATLAELTRDG